MVPVPAGVVIGVLSEAGSRRFVGSIMAHYYESMDSMDSQELGAYIANFSPTHLEGVICMSVRKPVVFAAVGSVLAAGLLLVSSVAQDKKPEKKTAREVYKNIKVLPKELPADQVIPIMHKINDSLGVKCDFCHVVTTDAQGRHVGWEKDDKPEKGMARKMIVMTGELRNKSFIKDKVTCFMCHHGHAKPEADAPEAPRR
jgi:hypothetical protein